MGHQRIGSLSFHTLSGVLCFDVVRGAAHGGLGAQYKGRGFGSFAGVSAGFHTRIGRGMP